MGLRQNREGDMLCDQSRLCSASVPVRIITGMVRKLGLINDNWSCRWRRLFLPLEMGNHPDLRRTLARDSACADTRCGRTLLIPHLVRPRVIT